MTGLLRPVCGLLRPVCGLFGFKGIPMKAGTLQGREQALKAAKRETRPLAGGSSRLETGYPFRVVVFLPSSQIRKALTGFPLRVVSVAQTKTIRREAYHMTAKPVNHRSAYDADDALYPLPDEALPEADPPLRLVPDPDEGGLTADGAAIAEALQGLAEGQSRIADRLADIASALHHLAEGGLR